MGGTEENSDTDQQDGKDTTRQDKKVEDESAQELWDNVGMDTTKKKEVKREEKTSASLSYRMGLDSYMVGNASWKDGLERDQRPPGSDVSAPGGSAQKKERLM